MKIEYSEDLRKYFDKKGCHDVVLRTISPVGCCGGAPELVIDLIKPSAVADSEKSGFKTFEGELGKVIMEYTLVPEDENATVSLGLKRFMGLADITATGLRQLA
ncbi:MAG: hypothetical protein IJ113_07040 [Eggerthellaceae bacterium]|nr:hypothetical protein [Eggerthellaceae bacterium]